MAHQVTQLGGRGNPVSSPSLDDRLHLIYLQPLTTMRVVKPRGSTTACETLRVRNMAKPALADPRYRFPLHHLSPAPIPGVLRLTLVLQSHNAYERGDGAAAHELSEEAQRHRQMADQYNKQASDYIFRENNAVGRVDGDTIDLHGQFVEEAEEILEARIKYAKQHGQTHLHV